MLQALSGEETRLRMMERGWRYGVVEGVGSRSVGEDGSMGYVVGLYGSVVGEPKLEEIWLKRIRCSILQ